MRRRLLSPLSLAGKRRLRRSPSLLLLLLPLPFPFYPTLCSLEDLRFNSLELSSALFWSDIVHSNRTPWLAQTGIRFPKCMLTCLLNEHAIFSIAFCDRVQRSADNFLCLHRVKPKVYDISLYDLELGGSWSYNGRVKIDASVTKATKEVVLNSKEITVQKAEVQAGIFHSNYSTPDCD